MKFKYLYQLLISHIGLLILAFLLLGLLFSQFVEEFVFQNKVDELSTYGERVVNDLTTRPDSSQRLLSHYNEILDARNIHFFIFNEEGEILFPKLQQSPMIKLTEAEWQKISEGKPVSVKHDLKRFDQEVTLVALPYLQAGNFAGGILLLSPITGSMEMVDQITKLLFYTIVISLSATFLLSWILSKNLVRRIQQLRNAASMIAAGKYDVKISSGQLDEIDHLANDFNHMAEELKKSNDEIERLEKRRRIFIADVSHEMKTPLTTIGGVVEGLKSGMIPGHEKDKSMELISRETKRLIRLVNENLDYEKIRSNQVTLKKTTIDLLDIFELVQDQLSVPALNKHIEMVIQAEGDITVYADYDRLVQILINIVKNSIQYTERGTVWLRGREEKDGTVVVIEDNGIGMDPAELESIWDRFYKADLSRASSKFGEFGLGLSIVKQLVNLHDGKIEVTSGKNAGTKFLLFFPKN